MGGVAWVNLGWANLGGAAAHPSRLGWKLRALFAARGEPCEGRELSSCSAVKILVRRLPPVSDEAEKRISPPISGAP